MGEKCLPERRAGRGQLGEARQQGGVFGEGQVQGGVGGDCDRQAVQPAQGGVRVSGTCGCLYEGGQQGGEEYPRIQHDRAVL